jgi:hypothetical protein
MPPQLTDHQSAEESPEWGISDRAYMLPSKRLEARLAHIFDRSSREALWRPTRALANIAARPCGPCATGD